MADKPIKDMSAAELKALNKELGAQIQRLQARKTEVLSAFALREEETKAAEAVRALSAHKRAALKRALEAADAEDKKAGAPVPKK